MLMIEVKDSAEFSRLLVALSGDIVNAHIHYRLYRDLREALRQHHLVAVQSNTFWSLTLQAHLNACIHVLCRVYDQNLKAALHLRSWLATIKENLHLFDEDQFRERLKDNPFVDSLAQSPRKPDSALLDQDIRSCSVEDPLVKTLTIHRGSRIVHKSARNVVAERDIGDEHPLTFGDVDGLLERAITILNRYSGLFAANSYSTQVVGHDDYEYIFKCVEEKVMESRGSRRQGAKQT